MKYLVTGGLGFIGSNLCRHLSNKKTNEILIIDNLSYAGSRSSLKELKTRKNLRHINCSILEKNKIERILLNYKPDILMHLAAETHVDRSIKGPKKFMETNILGTYNLLEGSRKLKKIKDTFLFVHVSTDEVFGDLGKSKKLFSKKTNYSPSSPYSASKASSDHLVRAWGRTFDLEYIITNCSNNYGQYQHPEKFIPTIISSAINKKQIPIYGDGLQKRDWLHVSDHVSALELIANKGEKMNTYLIGGGNHLTNLYVVKKICNFLNKSQKLKNEYNFSNLITFVEDRPGHDVSYGIDSSELKKELKWNPKISFDTGIEKTVNWYLDNKNWWVPLLKEKR
tara:strand:- start:606 stop:1622 length:1017 start_codon:yes stop_codon:yes gene_type:complete